MKELVLCTYQDHDFDILRREWNEAREYFRDFDEKKARKIFGNANKCRNYQKLIDHLLSKTFYGYTKYLVQDHVSQAIQDPNMPFVYQVSQYKVQGIAQPNVSTMLKYLSDNGIVKLIRPYDRLELGGYDEENVYNCRHIAKYRHTVATKLGWEIETRANEYAFNRFILKMLSILLLQMQCSRNVSFHINLDNLNPYVSYLLNFHERSTPARLTRHTFSILSSYLSNINLYKYHPNNLTHSYIRQIIEERCGIDVSSMVQGRLCKEEEIETFYEIQKALRKIHLEETVDDCINRINQDEDSRINDFIRPMISELTSDVAALNELPQLEDTNFAFTVHENKKNWCGDYFSLRVTNRVTTSVDPLNNPDFADLPYYQYPEGDSLWLRPKKSHRKNRYDVLEDLGLDASTDELYDIRSCLPNFVIAYQNMLKDPNAVFEEVDRHGQVMDQYKLENRNVAKIGAFRGIFNWHMSDGRFLQGIEKSLSNDKRINRVTEGYKRDCQWMKENGFMLESGYVRREIMNANVPKGNIFAQYCKDTFNGAWACRKMYKNDMYPSDLFIIESCAEVKTMLHFARQGHRVASAYDHLYSDGRIGKEEYHQIFARFATESIRRYIHLRQSHLRTQKI